MPYIKHGRVLARGFTLVELVLAVSMLAVTSIVLLSVFTGGLSVYRKTKAFTETGVADVWITLENIERDLRNAVNLSLIGFRGTEREVSFAAFKDGKEPLFEKITYFFDEKKQALFKKEELLKGNLSISGKAAFFQRREAFLKGAYFNYLVLDTRSHKYQWVGSWQAKGNLPKIVKISFIFQDGGSDVELSRKIIIPTAA